MQPMYDVLIVGGGSSGIAVASSLAKRNSSLKIAIIEPKNTHYYQPAWTLVGAGVYNIKKTAKPTQLVIPKNTKWIKGSVEQFNPKENSLCIKPINPKTPNLKETITYKYLVVACGLVLDWHKIKGLEATLGKNGVTSNYQYNLASYTWELVKNLQSGTVIFSQPPMPIKCAGAPQKAMYLSCDYWLKNQHLQNIDVSFNNAGHVLFGVKDYMPILMNYIKKYNINLNFQMNLIEVDGTNQIATFEKNNSDNTKSLIKSKFNLLHVVPPQSAPKFIKESPLADANGWLNVNPYTLQHLSYNNIYAVGDVANTPNAKTVAAIRKQAPVVAQNIISNLSNVKEYAVYNGYGSCPLTVERGKIVLAEFGYNNTILPTFPTWLLNGFIPSKRAWILKKTVLPMIYWFAMLKGHEWIASPKVLQQKDYEDIVNTK